ncbi:MAG: hypothetical protein WCT36_01630 [Candidatus Gracilibacteria bacterium]|jgi:hypothetical protein
MLYNDETKSKENADFEEYLQSQISLSFTGVLPNENTNMPSGWLSIKQTVGDYLDARKTAVKLNNPELLNKKDTSKLITNTEPVKYSKGNKLQVVYDKSKGIGVKKGFVKDNYGNDIIYSQGGRTYKETYDGKKTYTK